MMRRIVQRAREMGLVPDADSEIQPGDLYLAERNTGPKLLHCKHVKRDGSVVGGWVVPVEIAYCYDLNECVKIRDRNQP